MKKEKQDEKLPTYIASLHTRATIEERDKKIYYKGVSLAFFTSTVVLASLSLVLALKHKTEIPYVIEINREGDARYVSDAVSTLSSWSPSTTTVMNILRDYIVSLRGVTEDSSIQEERIKKVYSHSTKDAASYASLYLKETSPMERLRSEKVTVDVYAITPLDEKDGSLYQLDFNEKTYSISGTLKKEENYRAILKIKFYRPRTKGLQEANPLGIYVERIEISKIKDGYVIYDGK